MNKVMILNSTSCADLEIQVNQVIQILDIVSIQFQTSQRTNFETMYSCMIHYTV